MCVPPSHSRCADSTSSCKTEVSPLHKAEICHRVLRLLELPHPVEEGWWWTDMCVHVCACVYACVSACVCLCVCMSACVCMANECVYVYVFMCMCMCICVNVMCMCVHVSECVCVVCGPYRCCWGSVSIRDQWM